MSDLLQQVLIAYATKRGHFCEFTDEQLAVIESNIMVIETSLSDGHDEEIRAYANVLEHLVKARNWLKVAQGEAEQDRQRELIQQQLHASILQFKREKVRCAEIGGNE